MNDRAEAASLPVEEPAPAVAAVPELVAVAPVTAVRGSAWIWGVVAVWIVGVGVAAGLYLRAVWRPVTIAGLRAGGGAIGGLPIEELPAKLGPIAAKHLDERVTLALGDRYVLVRRADLGLRVDTEAVVESAKTVGRSGDPIADLRARRQASRGALDLPLPLVLDRARAVEVLGEIKDGFDRAPRDAHLDLDHHTVAPEQSGMLVQLYESLDRVERAALAGESRVQLAALTVPARVTQKELSNIDISTVVGAWESRYSTNTIDSDRTYNLKVGADHLNGHVLKPGELFSFNGVVGDRTEKEGYRVAPVISAGELIDGLAGGMCQIASTLHAAAFFAGLDIVSATPHSRPSAYMPLALDSTVVYGSTDLKIRNPYDFPIVIHYQVGQGRVQVELLGKARPYKVIFEREIQKENGFGTVSRKDPAAPKGQKLVLQDGYPGYAAVRRRYVLPANVELPKSLGGPEDSVEKALARAKIKPIKVERWQVHYPSTEEIVAWGSGSPRLKKKDPPPSHRIPAVPADQKPIARIVR